ncbi:unnamed protein product [Acanthoscelides obtectus]|uniref:Uncharacterized protein n=1 Tax=Acanthoscelides obtectus TaxID=200917 RepID=A0A9P0JRG7_ACAOB|nr:unnamed protein product [Acanthoscelides obtectus]CAK1628991.1 hypothetical protein AOBTE_LOCUS5514 [Acanthoscelides obtectus]
MPKPQYTQKFRDAWLKDPSLKEWLLVIDSTLGREAKCKFCSKIITSRYADLKSHDSDKCYTAQMLYEMYKDDTNYAFICFLKPILGGVQRVNKAFEAKNAESCKLLEDVTMLLNCLIKKVTTPNSRFKLFYDDIETFVVRDNYLGYLFENKIKEMKEAGFSDEANLRERKCIFYYSCKD